MIDKDFLLVHSVRSHRDLLTFLLDLKVIRFDDYWQFNENDWVISFLKESRRQKRSAMNEHMNPEPNDE